MATPMHFMYVFWQCTPCHSSSTYNTCCLYPITFPIDWAFPHNILIVRSIFLLTPYKSWGINYGFSSISLVCNPTLSKKVHQPPKTRLDPPCIIQHIFKIIRYYPPPHTLALYWKPWGCRLLPSNFSPLYLPYYDSQREKV